MSAPCPDRNLLAACAEGRLLPAEEAILAPHLAECDACRVHVGSLARATSRDVERKGASGPAARPRPAVSLAAWAVAAALLLAVGAWAEVRARSPAGDPDERFEAVAREVAAAAGPPLAGFHPLDRGERLARSDLGMRGSGGALFPRGVLLEGRPEFRWDPGVGTGSWTVAVEDSDGVVAWTLEAKSPPLRYPSDLPPLPAGRRWIWTARARGPTGPVEARAAFATADPQARARFLEALAAVDARAPADWRELMKAQLALRGDLLGEAEVHARAAMRARPEDPLARETLFQALDRMGDPSAPRLLEGR